MLHPLTTRLRATTTSRVTSAARLSSPAQIQLSPRICWPFSQATCRATPEEQLAQLRGSKDEREELAEEASAQVTEIADVDRTAELFIWLFSSMFGRNKGKNSSEVAPHDGAQEGDNKPAETPSSSTEVAVLGAGCYWTLDAVFRRTRGVQHVEVGFAGGHDPHPTYKKVCAGGTGHAEVVRVEYAPSQISLAQLLAIMRAKMEIDDQKGPQAARSKAQYRSIILCCSEQQEQDAHALVSDMDGIELSSPVGARGFTPSHQRHQRFYELNRTSSYCMSEIRPTLAKLHERFPDLIQYSGD